MKRLPILLPILILIFLMGTGCEAIKLGNRTQVTSPETETETTETIAPKERPKAEELFEQAKKGYVEAQDMIDAAQYDEAKVLLDAAVRTCLQKFNPASDPKKVRRLESLFLEICVTQVRLGHLRGTFIEVLPEDSPLELDYNPEIERWLSFFLTNGRRSMEIYLSRSGKYNPMIEKVLKEEGLPDELKYLPIIESGYSPYAYSPAHAVGLWQFIPGTGKHFGLRIDNWVDERRDPEKATRAAAAYLKRLYAMYNSWPLALASYNCGEGAVGRAIKRSGTNNFYDLDLPTETCNYVPKFYAAMLIARDPEVYGFFVQMEDPLDYENVVLAKPADLKKLAAITGVSFEDLKGLNPELLSRYTHPKQTYYSLRVPRTKLEQFKTAFEAAPDSEKYLSKAEIAKLHAPKATAKIIWYTVKKGDSLYKIARKYHTSVNNIKKWNPKARGKVIRPGMKLKIYPGRK